MTEFPPGFPLSPLDRHGRAVREGDLVVLVEIPEWLVHGLPADEAAAIRGCAGRQMRVSEVDRYGYLWLRIVRVESESEYHAQSFCIAPCDVLMC